IIYNFLHAPSTDLSRDTVKLLSTIMLAQAQECVCQTQIHEGKTGKTVSKLANQASILFNSALEGINEQVAIGIFERVWLYFCQVDLVQTGTYNRLNRSTFCPSHNTIMLYPILPPKN